MNLKVETDLLPQLLSISDVRIYRSQLENTMVLRDSQAALVSFDPTEGDRSTEKLEWIAKKDLVEESLRNFLDDLSDVCMNNQPWSSFLISVISQNEVFVRYRVQALDSFFAVTRLNRVALDLSEIEGITQSVHKVAMSETLNFKGGLVLCTGEPRTGKSLFAASVMRERLKVYGGYCICLGDPIEYFLSIDSNQIGEKGYWDKVDVTDIGYSEALQHILRAYPNRQSQALLYGEVRSTSHVIDLLDSASKGHMILATFHAASADAAVDRLILLALQSNLDVHTARSLVASTLFAVTTHYYRGGKYFVNAFQVTEPIRRLIRRGDPHAFKSTYQTSGVAIDH